jgi:hypothetical protein
LHRAPGQVSALRPCVTNTAFSFHWHARLHLQGPGMLRLKVSTPGAVIQLSKIFPHFFKENIEGLSGVKLKIPSINFHVEKAICTEKFLLFLHFQQNA